MVSQTCPKLQMRYFQADSGSEDARQEMTNFTRVKAWVLVQESDVEAKMAHCVHCCVGIVIVILMEYVTLNEHAL